MSLHFCKKMIFVLAIFAIFQSFSEVKLGIPNHLFAQAVFDAEVYKAHKVVEEDVADCCASVSSTIDQEVILELGSIESKLDQWIGPLTETINSKVDVKVEAIVDDTCCQAVKSTIDEFIVPELTSIESKLDNLDIPTDFPTTKKGTVVEEGSFDISTSGLYTLTDNTTSCVTISAERVTIDLCGFTLSCDGPSPVIEIAQDLKNIEIKNGKIKGDDGLTNDGIFANSGCELIKLDNVVVYSCDNGINFEGTSSGLIKSCRVRWCDVEGCNKGVLLKYTIKSRFKNCSALNCNFSGFEQEHSQFNIFDKCEALKTSNAEADQRAIGFKSSAGTGNLYTECVAEGTQKTDMSNFCHGAIGFLLTGTESDMEVETKIINCIANSTSVLATSSATAYGIFLAPVLLSGTLLENLKDSFEHGSDIFSVDWSPDGRYLAIGGRSPFLGIIEVRVLEFDDSNLSEIATFTHGDRIESVDWSPDGKFLAIGGRVDPTDDVEVRVLDFDGSDLLEITTFAHGDTIFSVGWSPDGRYLAIGGDPGSPQVRVLAFDGSALSEISTFTHFDTIFSVDWSPDGRYLAIGGDDAVTDDVEVRILEFDGSNLTEVDNFTHGDTIESVDWSPDGKYLAIGGEDDQVDNVAVRILEFKGSDLSEVSTFTHGDVIRSVGWSPDGKYLAIGGEPALVGPQVRVLAFDGSALSEITTFTHGDTIFSVDWSPGGRYLAIGGDDADDLEVRAFEVMNAPSGCLVDSNKVCNTTGGGFAGIGILGTGDNLYIKNILYANDVHFNGTIIPRFGNFFGPLLSGVPTHSVPGLLDNVFVD